MSPPVSDVVSPTVSDDVPSSTSKESSENLGRGLREKPPSVKLHEYVTYNAYSKDTPHHAPIAAPVETSSSIQGTSLYPINAFFSDSSFSSAHQAFLAAVIAGVEPTSYKKAVKDKVWRGAMSSEYEALKESGTFSIVDLLPGKVALGNQWIYKIKYHADGA